MIVGDPELRSGQGGQKQLCHRCEANIEQNPFGGAPCTGSDTFALPSGTCGGGIRATITFPTCVASSFTISPIPSLREGQAFFLTNETRRVGAGTGRTSIAPTTSPTWRTPAAGPLSRPARALRATRSSCRR